MDGTKYPSSNRRNHPVGSLDTKFEQKRCAVAQQVNKDGVVERQAQPVTLLPPHAISQSSHGCTDENCAADDDGDDDNHDG